MATGSPNPPIRWVGADASESVAGGSTAVAGLARSVRSIRDGAESARSKSASRGPLGFSFSFATRADRASGQLPPNRWRIWLSDGIPSRCHSRHCW
ncbi:hypothetical protein GCM10023321_73280 [Pseudonocardia eucalypti]|uniref:Uncharacterized protein n=1 Tax=Pseudonocardia eucalypti TaxID=648755 RepID=A0ABP9R8R9_9PSEU